MSVPIIRGTIQEFTGEGGDPQTIVLGSSLGTTGALWDGVVPALAEYYRVLRFDLPGHALSPAAGDRFSIAELADGVIAFVDDAGGGPFHYAGISIAGAVGLELALRHPERLLNLAVICSGAKIGAAEGWLERAAHIRANGTDDVIAGSAERWFAPGFVERSPEVAAATLARLGQVDDESYALCCDALAAFDVTGEVHGIRSRTLCVSGEYDLPTPTAQLQHLASRIPEARHVTIAGVAHLPALERPETVAALLLQFLRSHLSERDMSALR
ncbi:3-oxoadipate enol-lactonase [Marisediminicola sp. UYEF4]|uniref:alpha/beta fold hydrolase n=1 Tax=Marisediminicola sp. UYEF4 TaxID=1756384 RepID=UPI003398CF4C